MIAGLYPFVRKWTETGTLWCISDLHLGDEELRAGHPNRPSDDEIIRRVNARVGRTDHLLLLGDCGDPALFQKLRGHKILVMGNHDANKTGWAELCDEVYSGVLAISDKILLSHEPMPENVLETLGMINCSGHNHSGKHHPSKRVWNFCAEAIDFTPINMNAFVKSGALAVATGPHRGIIDAATKKARKRGYKYNGK